VRPRPVTFWVTLAQVDQTSGLPLQLKGRSQHILTFDKVFSHSASPVPFLLTVTKQSSAIPCLISAPTSVILLLLLGLGPLSIILCFRLPLLVLPVVVEVRGGVQAPCCSLPLVVVWPGCPRCHRPMVMMVQVSFLYAWGGPGSKNYSIIVLSPELIESMCLGTVNNGIKFAWLLRRSALLEHMLRKWQLNLIMHMSMLARAQAQPFWLFGSTCSSFVHGF